MADYDTANGCTFLADPSAPCDSGRGLLITTDTGRLRFDRLTDPATGKVSAKFVVDDKLPACIYAFPVNYSQDSDQQKGSFPHVDTARRVLVAHSTAGAPDGIHPDSKGNV